MTLDQFENEGHALFLKKVSNEENPNSISKLKNKILDYFRLPESITKHSTGTKEHHIDYSFC